MQLEVRNGSGRCLGVPQDESKMRAVMESMSIDTRVLEGVITRSVEGLRGDLKELGIEIKAKIKDMGAQLAAKMDEGNQM